MVAHARALGEEWTHGATRDLHHDASQLTLQIVARTLFDSSVADDARAIERDVTQAMELFLLFRLPLADLLFRLPLPLVRRYRQARARLHGRIDRLIAERRAEATDRGDLLSMLLSAQDDEAGGRMTDAQVRDEAITLFLAGHETTANALAWTFHLIAQHPVVEERLHRELDDVLGGRPPCFEDYQRLSYVERVVAEAMRLYPPVWCLGRRARRETTLGGYAIPEGAIVIASQWVTQRDARFFPDPERFDPERFTPAARAARPPLAYFPFGAGPRLCAGEAFAWMESVLVLATLAQRWRWRAASGAAVTPLPLLTLRPRHGLPMVLERRA
jgi:cytochrome P450